MSSILFAIVIMIALVAIVMLVFKPYDYGSSLRQNKKISNSKGEKDATETKWRSIKIRPGLLACKPAANLDGQIFLSQDAPSLPLGNCSESDCECHYIFLDDRRSGTDRRIELGRLGEFLPSAQEDRRNVRGRRMADMAA